MIPDRPYSFVAVWEAGPTSSDGVAGRGGSGPGRRPDRGRCRQIREVVNRLREAGHQAPGDANIRIVLDAGHDVTRPAFLLAGLPVVVPGRVRTDRVLRSARTPTTTRQHLIAHPDTGPSSLCPTQPPTPPPRPSRGPTPPATAPPTRAPGPDHTLCRPDAAPGPGHDGLLPIIAGSIIGLTVDRPPGDRHPTPVRPWCSAPEPAATDLDRLRQGFLRRFDIDHTFGFRTQTLGWTQPRIRTPDAADRWTRLIIAAHTRLRPARSLAEDRRRPRGETGPHPRPG